MQIIIYFLYIIYAISLIGCIIVTIKKVLNQRTINIFNSKLFICMLFFTGLFVSILPLINSFLILEYLFIKIKIYKRKQNERKIN